MPANPKIVSTSDIEILKKAMLEFDSRSQVFFSFKPSAAERKRKQELSSILNSSSDKTYKLLRFCAAYKQESQYNGLLTTTHLWDVLKEALLQIFELNNFMRDNLGYSIEDKLNLAIKDFTHENSELWKTVVAVSTPEQHLTDSYQL